jgi:hypothetical protein
MAAGFIVGSAIFALGAIPAYSEAAGPTASALTFFLGSQFFKTAAFLQYRKAADALAGEQRRRLEGLGLGLAKYGLAGLRRAARRHHLIQLEHRLCVATRHHCGDR